MWKTALCAAALLALLALPSGMAEANDEQLEAPPAALAPIKVCTPRLDVIVLGLHITTVYGRCVEVK